MPINPTEIFADEVIADKAIDDKVQELVGFRAEAIRTMTANPKIITVELWDDVALTTVDGLMTMIRGEPGVGSVTFSVCGVTVDHRSNTRIQPSRKDS